VYAYAEVNGPLRLAVKLEMYGVDHQTTEFVVTNDMTTRVCGIMRSRYVGTRHRARTHFYIMEMMDGNGIDFAQKLTYMSNANAKHLIDTFVQAVDEQIRCLFTTGPGWFFSEFELANIMYRRRSDGEVTVRLGEFHTVASEAYPFEYTARVQDHSTGKVVRTLYWAQHHAILDGLREDLTPTCERCVREHRKGGPSPLVLDSEICGRDEHCPYYRAPKGRTIALGAGLRDRWKGSPLAPSSPSVSESEICEMDDHCPYHLPSTQDFQRAKVQRKR